MPRIAHGGVDQPRKVPWGAALQLGNQGESTLEETSVVGELGVELEGNSRRFLVREKTSPLAYLKIPNGVTATQAHS